MSEGMIGDYEECKDKTGDSRMFCNALVFAEKHPKTALTMVKIGCPAMEMVIKHPSISRTIRKII